MVVLDVAEGKLKFKKGRVWLCLMQIEAEV